VWLTPVGDLQPALGRVHLDVRLDSGEDLGQLIALGATWQWDDPSGRWTVFADPEGNLFCAIPRQCERRAEMSLVLAASGRAA
jgi:Glyoxalase-like domain